MIFADERFLWISQSMVYGRIYILRYERYRTQREA